MNKPTATEAAAAIRADIKAALSNGDLTIPEGTKVSVRTTWGGMQNTVTMKVSPVPTEWIKKGHSEAAALKGSLYAIGRCHWRDGINSALLAAVSS